MVNKKYDVVRLKKDMMEQLGVDLEGYVELLKKRAEAERRKKKNDGNQDEPVISLAKRLKIELDKYEI